MSKEKVRELKEKIKNLNSKMSQGSTMQWELSTNYQAEYIALQKELVDLEAQENSACNSNKITNNNNTTFNTTANFIATNTSSNVVKFEVPAKIWTKKNELQTINDIKVEVTVDHDVLHNNNGYGFSTPIYDKIADSLSKLVGDKLYSIGEYATADNNNLYGEFGSSDVKFDECALNAIIRHDEMYKTHNMGYQVTDTSIELNPDGIELKIIESDSATSEACNSNKITNNNNTLAAVTMVNVSIGISNLFGFANVSHSAETVFNNLYNLESLTEDVNILGSDS